MSFKEELRIKSYPHHSFLRKKIDFLFNNVKIHMIYVQSFNLDGLDILGYAHIKILF